MTATNVGAERGAFGTLRIPGEALGLHDLHPCPAADDLPPWPGDWAALFARQPRAPGPYRTQGQPEGQP